MLLLYVWHNTNNTIITSSYLYIVSHLYLTPTTYIYDFTCYLLPTTHAHDRPYLLTTTYLQSYLVPVPSHLAYFAIHAYYSTAPTSCTDLSTSTTLAMMAN